MLAKYLENDAGLVCVSWAIYQIYENKHMKGSSVAGISIAIGVDEEYGQFEKEIFAYFSNGTTGFVIVPSDSRS